MKRWLRNPNGTNETEKDYDLFSPMCGDGDDWSDDNGDGDGSDSDNKAA